MSTRALTLAVEFALLAGVVVWGGASLPDRGRWVVGTTLLGLGLAAVIGLVVLLVHKAPVRILRLPHQEHWAKPENTSQARALLLDDVVDIFGDLVLLVVVIELLAVLRARSGDPGVPVAWLLVVVAVFLLSVGWRLFKLPGRYTPR